MSFHPAGHILGSSQIRIEYQGEVWVVSGDYKTQSDATCEPIEILRCHTFITESTFGLPIYQWPEDNKVFQEINSWWHRNQENNITSIIFCYALGKAQRILSKLDAQIGTIYTHGAIERVTNDYRHSGIVLPHTIYAGDVRREKKERGCLVLAPPLAQGSPWLRQFAPYSTGFASGWMRIRGARRRKSVDRGFVLSDHADWPGLMTVIKGTQAEQVIVTHGYAAVMTSWLKECGLRADSYQTEFGGEEEDLSSAGMADSNAQIETQLELKEGST